MKKLLITLVLVCIATTSFAQNEKKSKQFPNEHVSLITFNPLTPFAFDTPRYRIGYTQGISGHLRVGLEVGYGSQNSIFAIFRRSPDERDNYSLFEILPQVTYILNPKEKINHYFALQGFYLNHKEQFINDTYFDSDLNLGVRYDAADYERIKVGGNILYGIYIPFNAIPMGIDLYTGFGIRSRETIYTNLVNPRGDQFFDDDSFFEPGYRNRSGTTLGLNFSLGFRIFYNFND